MNKEQVDHAAAAMTIIDTGILTFVLSENEDKWRMTLRTVLFAFVVLITVCR